MNEIFVDKLIITQCIIFGIMTSIIISNKFHKATSFREVIGLTTPRAPYKDIRRNTK